MTGPRKYWIGLHQYESGKYFWADNSEVTFTYWTQGSPIGGQTVSDKCINNQVNELGCFTHYIDF